MIEQLINLQDQRWLVAPEVNALDDFNVMPNSTALARLMTEAAEYAQRWRLPVDAQAWWQRRDHLEKVVLEGLGLDPLPARTPLNARIIARHDMGDYTLENVDASSGSYGGDTMPANLFNDGWTSSLRLTITWDTRNNRLFPSDGHL